MPTAQSHPDNADGDTPTAEDLAGTTQEIETEQEAPERVDDASEPVDEAPGGEDEAATTVEDAAAPSADEAPEADGASAADEAPEEEPEVPRPYVNPLVEALRSELAERDAQLRSYITAYKEATADMERERERMARQRAAVLDRERMELSGRLLPVLDNLDRSLSGCTAGADPVDVAEGLRLVRDGFLSALGELGVERIDAMGATFDANLHEATAMIPATGKQSDQEIIYEELSGYTLKGKLLRATRVVVASRPD